MSTAHHGEIDARRFGASTTDGMAPLWSVLTLTFLASLGSGIMWSGIAFVAKHDYGYRQRETFLLYVVAGIIYVIGAFGAGRLVTHLERVLAPRGILVASFVVQAVACLLVILPRAPWALWVAALVMSLMTSFMWPIIESYLTTGRHGAAMRSALGWWNIAWTSAVALALLLMAPLVPLGLARYSVVAIAGASLACIAVLHWFPRRPAPHDEGLAAASTTPEYPALLRSVRVLLPASYLLIGALAPLLPYLLGSLEVRPGLETPMAATWMIARVITLAIMWRSTFWHGRWGTLLVAAVAMTIGFAGIVLAQSLAVLAASLVIFGAAQGVVYYAGIYYAMSVGRAAVDAGGTHEGLIGVGYALGPAAGLAGLAIGGAAHGDAWTIAIVWGLLALGLPPAVMPYVAARRLRGTRGAVRQPGA